MKLCIAEKPSVAKDLAEILGARTKRDGYFEGNGYCVSWTFGHLCSLKDPEDYNPNWKYWKLEDLPIIPQQFGIKIKDDQGVKKQFDLQVKPMHNQFVEPSKVFAQTIVKDSGDYKEALEVFLNKLRQK